MNTEKKLRGRPHKKEEEKLIGRRVSIEAEYWGVIDDFIDNQEINLAELLRIIAMTIYAASNKEAHEN